MVETAEQKETSPTPTVEEQLTALQSRLQTAETELAQTKKGLATAHQTLTEKDKELKKRAQVEDDITSIKEQLEVLAEAVARGSDTEIATGTDVVSQLKKSQQAREKQRLEQQFNETLTQYRVRTETLQLDPESEEYLDIQDLATRGNFKLADIRLKKLESKKATELAEVAAKSKTPTETEIEALVEARARKKLEDQGLLKTDSGTPGGAGGGKTYTASEITKMGVAEYRKAFPEYADYLRAINEGRIK